MHDAVQTVIATVLAICLFVVLPAAMIWGWVRWWKCTQPRTLSILSLVGFLLATISALLAISTWVHAHEIGGFPFNDPALLRIYRLGGRLSLAGLAFALIGIWRPSPLRWHAPVCAFGILLFWFEMAMGE
jgi:hypothetical protein